jgi:hypothetical protein
LDRLPPTNAAHAPDVRSTQRDGLVIRDLTPEAHARYTEQWYVVQARFVDDPRQTLVEAAELVALVMHERGYSVDGPDDCGDYVSVDYPEHAPWGLRCGSWRSTKNGPRKAPP